MQQLLMVGARVSPVVNLTAGSASSTAASAELYFNTNGSLAVVEDGITTTLSNQWLNPNPSADASLYEVQRTQVSGTTGVSFVGTLTSGTWYPLTSQRGVIVASAPGVRSNISTYSIRRASDLVVLVSGITISLDTAP
jgi:hypothetical protein